MSTMLDAQPRQYSILQGQAVPDGILVGQALAGDQRAFELLHDLLALLRLRRLRESREHIAENSVVVEKNLYCVLAANRQWRHIFLHILVLTNKSRTKVTPYQS